VFRRNVVSERIQEIREVETSLTIVSGGEFGQNYDQSRCLTRNLPDVLQ